MSLPPLVLIGPMASGKSRTGRRLAKRLGMSFTDTDQLIERQHGSIANLFATVGESGFRGLERDAVKEALNTGGVVAFGGGAILNEDTQLDLQSCAVAYLSTTADAVSARIAGNRKRPLLVDGGVERWSEIFEQRRAIYERLGRIHLDTSHRPMESIAEELAAWYRSRYGMDE